MIGALRHRVGHPVRSPAGPDAGGPGRAPVGRRVPAPRPGTTPIPVDEALRAVVETELEQVLQSLFTARQDVLEITEAGGSPESAASAERTIRGCTATVAILLGLLRESPGLTDTSALVGRLSGPFCLLARDGDVLYMNAAVTQLVGHEQRTAMATPFEERTWSDRDQMRRHLEEAHERGIAEDTFAVTRGDGDVVAMTFRTERLSEAAESLLLMTHVPGGERARAAAAQDPASA